LKSQQKWCFFYENQNGSDDVSRSRFGFLEMQNICSIFPFLAKDHLKLNK
jgi:hypothetical protein